MADADNYSLPTWQTKEPYIDLHCQLGEGPYYEKATNTLRFVDIKRKQLHSVSLSLGPSSLRTLQLDTPVSVTADIDGLDPQSKILIGAKYGIAVLDRHMGRYEYVTRFAEDKARDNDRLKGNDGAVDPHGRFWIGTMTDSMGPVEPEGSLFRFDGGKTRVVTRQNLSTPNSVGWSPDGTRMYFTHSTAKQVIAWDYAPADGSLSNERVLYHHDGPGDPDGFRVDKDGNLWHAVYGEGCVLKISPEGKLVGRVDVPTKNVTCPEFVGSELFITTAADEEGEGDSRRYGGGLFRVHVGTTGLPAFQFKMVNEPVTSGRDIC